jgi:hypothetical protein
LLHGKTSLRHVRTISLQLGKPKDVSQAQLFNRNNSHNKHQPDRAFFITQLRGNTVHFRNMQLWVGIRMIGEIGSSREILIEMNKRFWRIRYA